MSPDSTRQKRRKQLSELMQALNPNEPIGPEDSRYFRFHDAPGAPRGNDPVADLRAIIELSETRTTCQLFSGFRGSGKSSELLRLRAELVEAGFQVVLVDSEQVINTTRSLEPSDLLLSVAAAVTALLEERFGKNPAQRTLATRVVEFFQSFTLSEVGFGAGLEAGPAKIDLASFKFDLKANPSFKARVQDALRGKLTEFVKAFGNFMGEVRTLLGATGGGRCPVLIVDSLEKVSGSGPDQVLIQQAMEQIFWEFHWALRVDGWHSIWSCPPYLQLLNARIDTHYDGRAVLPMIRLWDNDTERTPNASGIEAVRRCLHLRGDVDSLFLNNSMAEPMINICSGHMRDLLQLLQKAVLEAFKQSDLNAPINEIVVGRLIDDYVSNYQKAIFTEDYPWLRDVAETRKLKADQQATVSRIAKLLDTAVVMTYRNGAEWFDVSAAVRRFL